MKKTKKGFTLVELVVVVAVLLILAAIAVPTVINLVNEANEAKNEANAQSIETAIKYAMAQNEISGASTYGTVKDALDLSGVDSELITQTGVDAAKKVTFVWNNVTKVVTYHIGTYTTAVTDEIIIGTGTKLLTGDDSGELSNT